MNTATRTFTFEAAHRLPEHEGKCRRLHGHHYHVELTVARRDGGLLRWGPQDGMVLDFGDVDDVVKNIIDGWDHRTLLWEGDPLTKLLREEGWLESLRELPFVPTAENLAEQIAMLVAQDLFVYNVTVERVTVWETPKGAGTWTP